MMSDMYCHHYLSCPCKCIRVWFKYRYKWLRLSWVKYQDFSPVFIWFNNLNKIFLLPLSWQSFHHICWVSQECKNTRRGVKVQGYYSEHPGMNSYTSWCDSSFLSYLIKGYFPEPLYKRYILFSLQRFNLGKSSSQNMAHTCTLYHIIWLCSNDAIKFIICPIFFKFFLNLNKTILHQLVIMQTNLYLWKFGGILLFNCDNNQFIHNFCCLTLHLLACCDLNKDMITAGQLLVNLWHKLNHWTFLAYLILA